VPARRERPRDEGELVEAVGRAARDGLTIRPVGTGHSFGAICVTDDCHVDLARMGELVDLDPETGVARVQAGMTIHALAEALHRRVRALENQGDVDAQSIAGALATATHGTGAQLPNLSASMVGGRLVTAAGEIVDLAADADRDVLRAARVSLGALGVLSELHLKTVEAFRIRKLEEPAEVQETLDRFDEIAGEPDQFEMFVIPHANRCLLLRSWRTDAPPETGGRLRRWFADDVLANQALGALQRIGRRWPQTNPAIGRFIGRVLTRTERCDHSHRVYANDRNVRFTESEWALPRAALREALEGVLQLIERHRFPVSFPIEVRLAAGDDALLSTAYGRDTAYVAVHQFVGAEYRPYFTAVQKLMSGLDGRPHWGKRHELTAAELAPRYPCWDRFQAVRARLDPNGTFTNAHLEQVLGPVGA
jgi:FAD-linked oxidoreductase